MRRYNYSPQLGSSTDIFGMSPHSNREFTSKILAETSALDIGKVLADTEHLRVEIGFGTRPQIHDKKFMQGHTYLGLEGGSHDNRNEKLWLITRQMAAVFVVSARQEISAARPDENIYFMFADGKATGLPDQTSGEVLLSNVVGNGMPPKEIEGLMVEARRILKIPGQLAIRETITPYPLPDLEDLLTANGLGLVAVEPCGDDGYTATVHLGADERT